MSLSREGKFSAAFLTFVRPLTPFGLRVYCIIIFRVWNRGQNVAGH